MAFGNIALKKTALPVKNEQWKGQCYVYLNLKQS